jgi:hypothetical protein
MHKRGIAGPNSRCRFYEDEFAIRGSPFVGGRVRSAGALLDGDGDVQLSLVPFFGRGQGCGFSGRVGLF